MITGDYLCHLQIFTLYGHFKRALFSHKTSWMERLIKNKYGNLRYDRLAHQKKIIENGFQNIDRPLNIFIVGEGKYGKSTLINALTGMSAADVDFLPKTWRIDIFRYGEEKAILSYNSGKTEEMSVNNARKIIEEEEKKSKADRDYESPLFQVEWYYNSQALKNLNIVDTPGIKQIRSQKTRITIEEHYYRADGVLWMLDATKVNSEVTEEFLKKLLNYRKKIIGVLNRWDRISLEDRERVIRKAEQSFEGYFITIIPVSAKNGFTGKDKGDSRLLSDSNIPLLENNIQKIFRENGKIIKNISIYYNFLEAIRESREILTSEANSCSRNWKTYCRTKETISQKGSEIEYFLQSIIQNKIREYFTGIYRRIEYDTKFRTVEKELYPNIIGTEKLKETIEFLKKEIVNSLKNGIYNLIQHISSEKYEELTYDYDGSILSQITMPTFEDIISEVEFNVPEVNIVIHTPLWNKCKEWASDKPILNLFINKEKLQIELNRLKWEIKSQITTWEEKITFNFNREVAGICRKNFTGLKNEVERKFKEIFGSEEDFHMFTDDIKDMAQGCILPQHILSREFIEYIKEIRIKE